jgi:iron complex transport system substrate-binding protein
MESILPKRIVYRTEQTTEWSYLLGGKARILGIAGYTFRHRRAREEKFKLSVFVSAKIVKILALQPNAVFGLFDRSADSAAIPKGEGRTFTDASSMSERSVDIAWPSLQVFSYGEAQHA